MIIDLREINRLLLAINELTINEKAKLVDVIDECKNIVLGGKNVNHEETINFCILSGIILQNNEFIKYTPLGQKIFKANIEGIWELNNLQKTLLIENCFLDDPYSQESIAILKQFLPDNKRKTFVFSKQNIHFLHGNPSYIQLLKQVGLILEDEKLIIVNPEFSKFLSFLLSPKKMSYDELEQKLKIDKEVGDIAEQIVLEYEKNRLKNDESANVESKLVQIISGTDVTAGYDVESFDGQTTDLKFNRHIEVKGSVNHEFSFYWSSGEIKKSLELKESYWIYFVSGIDRRNTSHNGEIIRIPNPGHEILDTGKYFSNCTKYHITKNNYH
ncbi:MAG: DUF3883 domain-containing protein [Candidatus Nitrosopelagicus sp.]|mgnify:FL=1|jgi:hypothetical protein|nr:DUF3883 domain-containing protein [Candidatus Nitrosopelagicus sp.]